MAVRSVPALMLEDEYSFRQVDAEWKEPMTSMKPLVILQSSSAAVVYDVTTNSVSVQHLGQTPSTPEMNFCPLCHQPLFKAEEGRSNPHDYYFKFLRLMYVREGEAFEPHPNNFFEGLDSDTLNTGYYLRFFQEDRKIGSGGFGGVYVTQHHLNGVNLGVYAVKKVPVGDSRTQLRSVLKEVRLLEQLRHPNIVAYKHSWVETFRASEFCPEVPCLFILMEFARCGTVSDLLWPKVSPRQRERRKREGQPEPPRLLDEALVWHLLLQLLAGMHCLQQAGIIHRDIKPENLLLTSSELNEGSMDFCPPSSLPISKLRLLISDFGESRVGQSPYTHTGNTGTLAYAAPELLDSNVEEFYSRSDEKCDIWSLGVTLYAMTFSELPFAGETKEALRAAMAQGVRFPATHNRSPELLELISKLLVVDVALRPDLQAVLRFPILQHAESVNTTTTLVRKAPVLLQDEQHEEIRVASKEELAALLMREQRLRQEAESRVRSMVLQGERWRLYVEREKVRMEAIVKQLENEKQALLQQLTRHRDLTNQSSAQLLQNVREATQAFERSISGGGAVSPLILPIKAPDNLFLPK